MRILDLTMQLSRRIRGPYFFDNVACASQNSKATEAHKILKVIEGKLAIRMCSATIISYSVYTLYKGCWQHISQSTTLVPETYSIYQATTSLNMKGGLDSACKDLTESDSMSSSHQPSPQTKSSIVPKTKKGKQRLFTYSHCPRTFERLCNLKRYENNISCHQIPKAKIVPLKRQSKDENKRYFECSLCKKTYTLSWLYAHQVESHLRSTNVTFTEVVKEGRVGYNSVGVPI
jgi:hypothetical protein